MKSELGNGGSLKGRNSGERPEEKKRLQVGGKTVFTADKEEQLVSWIESLSPKNSVYTKI